jgi:chaperonin GroES
MILVRAMSPSDRTSSGILIPETVKESPKEGLVIAIGDSSEIKVKVGDQVIFSKDMGFEITFEGSPYLILPNKAILAVIE